MRGDDERQEPMWSYVSAEDRIPADLPLRAIRKLTDPVLRELSPLFESLYSKVGRPSIAPERLLRALLLQLLYTIRSERLLMEQLDYNILFRWFVGLSMDDAVELIRLVARSARPNLETPARCRKGRGLENRPLEQH